MNYEYDPGDGRYKHKWNKKHSGFQTSGSGYIGKCDSRITTEIAQAELNKGVPDNPEDASHPKRIYVWYNGALYEAVPTNPGQSYHAYPWRGDLPGRSLPRRVQRELERIAEQDGTLMDLRKWLKNYGQ